MEPEGLLLCSLEPAAVTFRKELLFYGEKLLAPQPTPKLEDHSPYLEAVSSIRNPWTRLDPLNMAIVV